MAIDYRKATCRHLSKYLRVRLVFLKSLKKLFRSSELYPIKTCLDDLCESSIIKQYDCMFVMTSCIQSLPIGCKGESMDKYSIDPKSPIPVWAQTKSRLLYLILSGCYKENDKLPTVRDLAVELGINYNTANKAYQDLERDGYVRTVRGKGCFVTDKASQGFSVVENNLDLLIQGAIDDAILRSMTGEEVLYRFASKLYEGNKLSRETFDGIKEVIFGESEPSSIKEAI